MVEREKQQKLGKQAPQEMQVVEKPAETGCVAGLQKLIDWLRPPAADAEKGEKDATDAEKGAADAKKDHPTEAGKRVTSTEDWLKNGITMEEVEKHNHEGSAWIVVNDRVYDCTPYLKNHPGGASSIMISAGLEATDDFEAVHSKRAWDLLEDHYIGPLRTANTKASAAAPATVAGETFLKPREFQ